LQRAGKDDAKVNMGFCFAALRIRISTRNMSTQAIKKT